MLIVVCPMCGTDVPGFPEDGYNGGWDAAETRQNAISCPNREGCGHTISPKFMDDTDEEPVLLVSGPDVSEGHQQFDPDEYVWREADF